MAVMLHWPIAVATAWWEWATTRTHPNAAAFRVATERLLVTVHAMRDPLGRERLWRQYKLRQLSPRLVVEGLETLHERGELDRGTATRLEEGVLTCTDKHGRWKFKKN
jgi:hypothetical protein